MAETKVSIMIPAYNVEQYIERCIISAINQTLRDIEIIVVNDGSTDNTSIIIDRLAQEDSRIVIINKKNAGLPSARNSSLDVAKGEYIQILDGDDWLEKTACEELYNFAKKNELDLVVTDYYLDDDSGTISYEYVFNNAQGILSSSEVLQKIFTESDSGMLCNRFVHKELYTNLRLPEHISYGEDIVTSSRLAIKSNRTAKLEKAFYHYIYNPKSITKDEVGKKAYQYFEGFDFIRDCLHKAGIAEEQEKNLQVLECNKVSFFMFQQPFFYDVGYTKSVNMALDIMKRCTPIPNDISLIRKVFLYPLSLYPKPLSFKILSSMARSLRRVKG
jgi:glycosyltransferase involved in cell wall biosynthesis